MKIKPLIFLEISLTLHDASTMFGDITIEELPNGCFRILFFNNECKTGFNALVEAILYAEEWFSYRIQKSFINEN